ncbi:FKBP-like protein, partial [Fragilariopsis cylindrus CCMP1102]
ATNQVGSIMLKGNKYNPAITTLESGLQYKIVRSGGSTGTGEEHPTLYSPCKINYIGKTLNSKIFDSSSSNFVYNEDIGKILAPYQVIVCLQEAMQLMVVGDKWSLYCPSELAYGDIGSNEKNIYPGDMLMYDLELLEI